MRYLSKEEREGATSIMDAENKVDLRNTIEAEKFWQATH